MRLELNLKKKLKIGITTFASVSCKAVHFIRLSLFDFLIKTEEYVFARFFPICVQWVGVITLKKPITNCVGIFGRTYYERSYPVYSFFCNTFCNTNTFFFNRF